MIYYNEFEKYPAQWLRNLFPDSIVDERSIVDVKPSELEHYTQCHFFAGIGGWSYALRLAGWPEDRPVWTGSCPCQPFSNAGKGKGCEDERHLWPAFRWLIAQCKPPIIFGEQVASKLGREWLAGVRSDLEALGYEVGAADLCAAGVGAPHIRQRLFWVAYTGYIGQEKRQEQTEGRKQYSEDSRVEITSGERRRGRGDEIHGEEERVLQTEEPCGVDSDSGVGNTSSVRCNEQRDTKANEIEKGLQKRPEQAGELYRGIERSCWNDYTIIPCADGKARRIKPGIMPLANGVPARVGAIKAYGNAIVPQIASVFIRSFMETINERVER